MNATTHIKSIDATHSQSTGDTARTTAWAIRDREDFDDEEDGEEYDEEYGYEGENEEEAAEEAFDDDLLATGEMANVPFL